MSFAIDPLMRSGLSYSADGTPDASVDPRFADISDYFSPFMAGNNAAARQAALARQQRSTVRVKKKGGKGGVLASFHVFIHMFFLLMLHL
jgi:hypothetical protein